MQPLHLPEDVIMRKKYFNIELYCAFLQVHIDKLEKKGVQYSFYLSTA